MLTKLKNGVHIRLADVRSIKVEQLAKQLGWEAEWGVRIAHGDSMHTETETCVFDTEHGAHRYADEIAGRASQEQADEFNALVEKDQRRERDRFRDRVCVVASGLLANSYERLFTVETAIGKAAQGLREVFE